MITVQGKLGTTVHGKLGFLNKDFTRKTKTIKMQLDHGEHRLLQGRPSETNRQLALQMDQSCLTLATLSYIPLG